MMKIMSRELLIVLKFCVFNIIESWKNRQAKNHWIYLLTDRIVGYVNDISRKLFKNLVRSELL